MNINTEDYWDTRFATGDWEHKQGREQTRLFTEAQVEHFAIPPDFRGTILDFGCGLGDSMPVYHTAYPLASLIGMDISAVAIEYCTERYGLIARFIQGDYTCTPCVDVIIASNVCEHLSDDVTIAAHLLTKCRHLFIITPYREILTPHGEHINSYDKRHFAALGACDYRIFKCKGWGRNNGWIHELSQRAKNIVRPLLGKQIVRPMRQILFHFVNNSTAYDEPIART